MQPPWLKMQMQSLRKRMMSAITHILETCVLRQVMINVPLEVDVT
jgi:hypothetical protein